MEGIGIKNSELPWIRTLADLFSPLNLVQMNSTANIAPWIDISHPDEVYVGFRDTISEDADALGWKIVKIRIVLGVIQVTYAGGVETFNKAWNLRETYTYS